MKPKPSSPAPSAFRRTSSIDEGRAATAMTLANSLDAFWLPFTNNRGFKAQPRMFAGAKGMHYVTPDGRKVLDGTAGLWCVNAGHGRERIIEAIRRQAGE